MSLQRFISELCKGPGTLAVVVLNLMVLSRAQALSITSQPQTQTNNEGQSVTFTVSAQGVPPFAYQWLKGDELIPGATNDAYSIASAAVSDAGIYSVNVSDAETNVSSITAGLWVIATPRSLLAFTNSWKYNAAGSNLGVSWRGTNYNDGSWPEGAGCFGTGYLGNGSSPLTDQIRTLLSLTNSSNAKITTYYFRTHFSISNNPSSAMITITNLVDDGAVFYVNSNEVSRFNMPAPPSPIVYFSTASSSLDATYKSFEVPASTLVLGDNVLAVEVHNASVPSVDIGFGASAWATFKPVGPPSGPVTISVQPVPQFVLEGDPVVLEATVAGPFQSLRWYRDGSELSGQTNLQLQIVQAHLADAGQYVLMASNAFGRVYTDPVQLGVIGDNSFRYSLFPWTNTWRYATSSIVDISWKDTVYDDSFWNSGVAKFGAVVSGSVPTTTYLPPGTNTLYFRTHFQLPYTPESLFLISSNLLADGAVFYLNGAEVSRYRLTNSVAQRSPGSGGSVERTNLPTANLKQGDNVMAVELHVAPNSGLPVFAESLSAVPKTFFPLSILKQPSDLNIPDYGTLSFQGEAFGSPPILFQWFHNEAIISGATNKILILSNAHASDAGQYFFIATNPAGSITSSVARASVPPFIITTQPSDTSVPEYGTLNFIVNTLGSAPAVYQWFHDGSIVSGATNKSLSISNVHPANAGVYFFVGTTSAGSVTSTIARATVIADSVAPLLQNAVASSLRTIVVEFSEKVEPSGALDSRNYSFSPPIQVSALTLLDSNMVVIKISGALPQPLQLTVNNVRDAAIPGNSVPTNSTLNVLFDLAPSQLGHPLTSIKTVFLVIFENHSWEQILGNTNAPYFNSLLPVSSYASRYFSPPGLHPSLPNYLWLEAGTNFGIFEDGPPSWYNLTTREHLTRQLDRAGITWKSYQENISGTDCPTTGVQPYAVRHNPVMYFSDVTTSFDYCTNHVRPYTELEVDLANNTVSGFNYITPNYTNDMHNRLPGISEIKVGDNWLAAELPKILNSTAYSNNGAVFITWDEDDFGTPQDPIGMIVLSPLAKGGGYTTTNYYTHSSTLRTFQEIFGVRPFLGDAANCHSLEDLFKLLSLTSVGRLPDGSTRLTLTNTIPGKTNLIQASRDLVNWSTISTNVSAGDSVAVVHSPSGAFSNRFYRAYQLP